MLFGCKLKRKDTLKIAGSILTAVVLVVLFFGGLAIHFNEGQEFELPRGWKLRRGDKIFENIPLEDMSDVFTDVKRREVISMSHPLIVDSHDPLTLRVYSRLSAVRVMIDDRQIYSYGFVDVAKQRMVGSGYHFVLLPTSYYGKMMKIELIASEDDAVTAAPEIVITPADEAISMFAKERIFGIFSGLFMIIAGIALIILSVPAIYMDRRFYPLAIIGVFSCAAGIWCLSTIKALQLFSGDITLNSIMEYLSLYIMPFPALFLSLHFRRSASPLGRKVIIFVTVVSGLYFLAALILQVTDILDVTEIVGIYHLLLIPYTTCLLFAGNSKWRRMKAAERLFQVGLYFISAITVLEVSVYYVVSMVYELTVRMNTITTPLAVLTLDVVMTIGFLLEIYDMRLKDTERERLQKLANRDQMTGLMNRGMCERRFTELKESGEDFVILNMDLNGLKDVNDHFGHLQGDEYIQVFAEAASKALGGSDDLYRVGGDEFLYITTGLSEDEVYRKAALIKKLEKIVEMENNFRFSIDASYGIAGSAESGYTDPEDVYRLADKRMYEMKRSLKKERN